ncbi:MAG: glutathione S-transferase N-terminal domain-containing protein [Candidatus Pacebacteria bacterium]|nr:glutathione S-transferase N-terminal domain-containing protein [Candidatus Paceibacterota bacterium]
MVTIYSTTMCPYCKLAKEYLTQRGISFKEHNVQNDDEALAKMVHISGQMGVPVIEIDGKVIVGFDKSAIDNTLGLQETKS